MRALASDHQKLGRAGYAAAYSEGEVVVFNRDYRRTGVQKGVKYRVTDRDLTNNRVTLTAPDGKSITFDPSRCIEKKTYAVQEIAIAPGDQLRWTRNDHKQGLRNGQLVTVTAIDLEGTATLQEATDSNSQGQDKNKDTNKDTNKAKEMTLSLTGQQYLDYALVSTTYSAQGKTAERVLAIADQTLSKEGLYVAVSRAKRNLSLYTTSRAELHKRAERSSAKENPSDVLSLCELVNPHAENEKAPRTARIVRRISQSERLGDRIGAVVESGYSPTLRRDGTDASRDWTTERTAASVSRGVRANAAESHRAAAAAGRAIERSVSRRRVFLENQAQRRRRREVYERYAAKVGDFLPQDCDRLVARQLMMKILDARDGQELTQDELVRVGRVLLEGPVSQELKQSQGKEASREYVIRVLEKEQAVVEKSQQAKLAKEKSKDQGMSL